MEDRPRRSFPSEIALQLRVNALRAMGFSGMEAQGYANNPELAFEAISPSGIWRLKVLSIRSIEWDFIAKASSAAEAMRRVIDGFASDAHMSPQEKAALRPVLVRPMTEAEVQAVAQVINDPKFLSELSSRGYYQVE